MQMHVDDVPDIRLESIDSILVDSSSANWHFELDLQPPPPPVLPATAQLQLPAAFRRNYTKVCRCYYHYYFNGVICEESIKIIINKYKNSINNSVVNVPSVLESHVFFCEKSIPIQSQLSQWVVLISSKIAAWCEARDILSALVTHMIFGNFSVLEFIFLLQQAPLYILVLLHGSM